ncbi:MAG: LVIVD repeat-containing protein [Putridiphycobacter sp.]
MKITVFFILLFVNNLVLSQDYFNVQLLDSWTDTTLIQGPSEAYFSDVWGFNFENQNYAVLGSSEGAHIFKIENNQLILVDFKPAKYQSLLVQHRDYKTYKNYLYAVCDEGTSSLEIFDLSYLPDSIHKVYDSDQYFQICHNLYIDTNRAKLYACGTNNQGMKVFDISQPDQPTLWYDFNQTNYVHDCFVVNDTAFLNCGFDGLHIYDFSTQSIQQLGVLDFYVEQGYNHSGWLSEDRKKYVFIDESLGKKVKVCDATQLDDIAVSFMYGTSDYANKVAHNVQIFSDYMFISYYNEGLRIVDIAENKANEVAYFDTFHQQTDYKLNGAWGVYVFKSDNLILVSDRQNGLFLFYFPIALSRAIQNQSVVTNTPFIDENSVIVYPFDADSKLKFTIYGLEGKIYFEKESILKWVNVPLNLPNGSFIFVIYSDDILLDKGRFVVQK